MFPPTSPGAHTPARGTLWDPALPQYHPRCFLVLWRRRWLFFTSVLRALSTTTRLPSRSRPNQGVTPTCALRTRHDVPLPSFKMEHPTANSFCVPSGAHSRAFIPLYPVLWTAGPSDLQKSCLVERHLRDSYRGWFHLAALSLSSSHLLLIMPAVLL